MKKIILIVMSLLPCLSHAQIINTIAGTGTAAYSGDGGTATAANLHAPIHVITDAAGNIYTTDFRNNVIRKINSSGVITTIAGTGTPGFSGDGGPATAATFDWPSGLCLDAAGNLFVSDYHNNRIRKINTAGIVTTIAGTGATGHSGDGGPATAATFNLPQGLCMNLSGELFIADANNSCIRKINLAGIITNVAGTGVLGFSGDGGPASTAQLANPLGITIDNAGRLFIADQNNDRIRMVNASGLISTLAGNGTRSYGGDGGPATNANLNIPAGVFYNPSDACIYIADQWNGAIRKVDAGGTITAVAGTGTMGYGGDGGSPLLAQLYQPVGIWIDAGNNIYIADQNNNRIRKITSCTPVIGLQPKDDTVTAGTTALFVVSTSVALPGYQWQSDAGSGFTDLTNTYPYSGVNKDTLKVSTSYALNGTKYRCIIMDESTSCPSTSSSAILTIMLPSGGEIAPNAVINVFPNPVHDELKLLLPGMSGSVAIKLINNMGQVVAESTSAEPLCTLKIAHLPAGNYIMRVDMNGAILYKKISKI